MARVEQELGKLGFYGNQMIVSDEFLKNNSASMHIFMEMFDKIEVPNSTPAEIGDVLNIVPDLTRAPLPPIMNAV